MLRENIRRRFDRRSVNRPWITPLYRTDEKRFSTKFNFGDYISLGYELGHGKAHEIGLRLEHYSNAGIDSPNPGEEFLHLRYRYHLVY